MPIHDWSRVEAGIFHDFHHAWIEEIKRALNSGLLPEDYYALAEQFAGESRPDVLSVQTSAQNAPHGNGQRVSSVVAVRQVTGDKVVAVVEIVCPGNKAGCNAFQESVDKSVDLLHKRMHLLILDLLPPAQRDPQGIHGAIWEELSGEEYVAPPDKPLTLAAYESAPPLRAYVEPAAVGDTLAHMPLFLQPEAYVLVPLEAAYEAAWRAVPRRWQRVLEAQSS